MGAERDDGIGEELQDQAVERIADALDIPDEIRDAPGVHHWTEVVDDTEVKPWPAQPAWANTAVHGRYPAGTDPFLALKDAMGVFMERTDGTNAMPWWQLPPYRWWHAGPSGLKRGDKILPPSETGKIPALESDREAVYVTSERPEAVMYAAYHLIGADRAPVLYEVMLDGEPQPDDTQPDSTTSFRVPSATVRRIEVPSKRELSGAIAEIMAVGERAMMIEQGEKPCEPIDCDPVDGV